MNEFYLLNKKALHSFLFLTFFLLFLCLLIMLYFMFINFQSNGIILTLLVSTLIILIFGVIFFENYYIWSKRKKLLNDLTSIYPFSELHKIGFNNDINIYDSGIKYLGKTKLINDIQIVFYVFQSSVCVFEIPCDSGDFSWEKFLELKAQNFILTSNCLKREINYKKETKSIQEIESMLNEMILLVKKNNFPLLLIDKNGNY